MVGTVGGREWCYPSFRLPTLSFHVDDFEEPEDQWHCVSFIGMVYCAHRYARRNTVPAITVSRPKSHSPPDCAPFILRRHSLSPFVVYVEHIPTFLSIGMKWPSGCQADDCI